MRILLATCLVAAFSCNNLSRSAAQDTFANFLMIDEDEVLQEVANQAASADKTSSADTTEKTVNKLSAAKKAATATRNTEKAKNDTDEMSSDFEEFRRRLNEDAETRDKDRAARDAKLEEDSEEKRKASDEKDNDGESKASEADDETDAQSTSDSSSDLSSEALPLAEQLTLADVVASLYRAYPDINRMRQQSRVAGGELMSAYGSYDTKFNAFSISEPTGFYENFRNGLGLARQTWWGGYLAAGYWIGRGDFQPWYKERQTDEAGELKVAFVQPLLRGRAIDAERVVLFQASLAQQAAQPMVQQAILESSRDAADIYWAWVAAGAVLEAQRELLEIAEKRGEQYEVGVKAGKFPEIDLILNQQLIAERRAKVLETEQKFRASSFKLAVFLRDGAGQPMVPDDTWLPRRFPTIQPPPESDLQAEIAAAWGRRPEPQILQFELRQVQLDRRLACNQMLPSLDFIAEASQDMGPQADPKIDDKGEFELVIGIQSEVPIQRRKARGKLVSTNAKMVQLNEKIRLVQDKIAAELRIAFNALQLSTKIVEQSELSLRAAIDTLERYRFAFDQGKIDLIYLNLLETKANETEIKLVEAQQAWFAALAQTQIALGLDPLEQAMLVSELPASDMPGPGNLPSRSDDDSPGDEGGDLTDTENEN